MNACTVIAHNRIAGARVLAESFARHHPGSTLTVMLVDDHVGHVPAEPNFSILRLSDIGLEPREIARMRMIYTAMEFTTAMKPLVVRHLLSNGARQVLYLDADIEIFASLEELAEVCRIHSLALTPHATTPIPRDGLHIEEELLLLRGTYNSGFIGVSPAARAFVDWWAERLRRHCLEEPSRGLFADQMWINLAAGYFPHYEVRDPGSNVAYWNLHSREVVWTGERYEVNGSPLRFFHFSGFDPRTPDVLTKYQGDKPRIVLSERPAVARICVRYAERLLQSGYEIWINEPYHFATMPNGMEIDRRMRRAYARGLELSVQDDEPEPPNPFLDSSPDAFRTWLNEPGPKPAPRMSRYLRELFDEQMCARQFIPPGTPDRLRCFHDWVRTNALHLQIPPEYVPG